MRRGPGVYVITFGREGIRNGWVEVHANSEQIARWWANREYKGLWSGCYSAEEFAKDSHFFPAGALTRQPIPLFYTRIPEYQQD